MTETTYKYKIPSYYPQFACKGGNCRNSCCIGWDVTISFNEYCRLHELDCSEDLKEKINETFAINHYPSRECFAKVAHNEKGDCPLHMDNGYCLLHANFGESILPAICQYYP